MGLAQTDPQSLGSSNLAFVKEHLKRSEWSTEEAIPYTPKRLLDLGTDPRHAVVRLQVVEHEAELDAQDRIKYATLSYCWGPKAEAAQQLRLTVDNINQFRETIPPDKMTPVLRDAISVCHSLDIRYLWVDSLCILQGGKEQSDWAEQSYEMSRIFGNSWLTICAVAASSCTESFLRHIDRDSPRIQFDLYSKDLTGFDGPLQLRLCTKNGRAEKYWHAMLPQWPLTQDLSTSTWYKRGWVYQEKALSPRKLFFGARMIHFQDQHHVFSENGHTKNVSLLHDSEDPFSDYSQVLSLDAIQSQHPFCLDVWYRIAKANAALELTDGSDVFPAISGIARMFAEVTSCQYLAGLWTEDLHCGLLWNTQSLLFTNNRRRRPASLLELLRALRNSSEVAPSWSWASRRNFGNFLMYSADLTCRYRTHLKPRIVIENTRANIDGANPFGRIQASSITLRGNLMMIPTNSRPRTWAELGAELGGFKPESVPRWICKLGDSSVLYIDHDWAPKVPTETGLRPKLHNYLRLLLIADCCAGQQSGGVCYYCRGTLDQSHKPRRARHDQIRNGRRCFLCSDLHGIQKQRMFQKSYTETFYQDSEPGFVADRDCPECADKSLKRDVWGLLIFPTGQANEYYRVGTFFSRAECGGTDIFRDAVESTIVLV